jgi:hypothetical protein
MGSLENFLINTNHDDPILKRSQKSVFLCNLNTRTIIIKRYI